MRLGILLRYAGLAGGPRMEHVLEAERLGYTSVWAASPTARTPSRRSPGCWPAPSRINAGTGIMQMSARTPACAAMTAATLQAMSNNRFLLGIGPSGPQVIEGWHGMPYGKPLTRTNEYIEIVRKVFAREAPLTHQGEHYQIPYAGADASGLGKPLKSIAAPQPRSSRSTPPRSRRRACAPPARSPTACSRSHEPGAHRPHHRAGARRHGWRRERARRWPASTSRRSCASPWARTCRPAATPSSREMALYIGGMGARGKNFYNDYVKRMGYEAAAAKIQDAYLAGRRDEAIAAVPDSLIDEIGAGRPARAHQGSAAGLEGGLQGRRDRHHAAGRRQHRGAACRRRSRGVTGLVLEPEEKNPSCSGATGASSPCC